MSSEETVPQPRRRDRYVQAIAIFKFIHALLFLLAALGAFGLMQENIADAARDWGSDLALTSGQQVVPRLIMLLTGLSRSRIAALGLVALFYAALYTTEGIGLWREKRWGEYLTVIATASFIPFEIWEITYRPAGIKFAVLAGNVLVVAYLIYRLRHPRRATHSESTLPHTTPEPQPEQSRVG